MRCDKSGPIKRDVQRRLGEDQQRIMRCDKSGPIKLLYFGNQTRYSRVALWKRCHVRLTIVLSLMSMNEPHE
jgi:hypothetical protein